MVILRSLIVLGAVLLFGLMYYYFSISRNETFKQLAFFMKIFYLILSFILAFVKQDSIIIGDLAFGGRAAVMILIMIEIVDSFIDKKKE